MGKIMVKAIGSAAAIGLAAAKWSILGAEVVAGIGVLARSHIFLVCLGPSLSLHRVFQDNNWHNVQCGHMRSRKLGMWASSSVISSSDQRSPILLHSVARRS